MYVCLCRYAHHEILTADELLRPPLLHAIIRLRIIALPLAAAAALWSQPRDSSGFSAVPNAVRPALPSSQFLLHIDHRRHPSPPAPLRSPFLRWDTPAPASIPMPTFSRQPPLLSSLLSPVVFRGRGRCVCRFFFFFRPNTSRQRPRNSEALMKTFLRSVMTRAFVCQ